MTENPTTPTAENIETRVLHTMLCAVAQWIDMQRLVQPEAALELAEAARSATLDVHVRLPTLGERGYARVYARNAEGDAHLLREIAFVGTAMPSLQ